MIHHFMFDMCGGLCELYVQSRCITHVSATHVLHLYSNTYTTCVRYTPVLHMQFYTGNTCVGKHLYYMSENIYSTGVLHMYYRCMNYMHNTPNTIYVHMYYLCITHVTHLGHISCLHNRTISNLHYSYSAPLLLKKTKDYVWYNNN